MCCFVNGCAALLLRRIHSSLADALFCCLAYRFRLLHTVTKTFMPLDGFSPEQPQMIPVTQEKRFPEAEARVQQAEIQVRAAQKEVDSFFDLALSGNRLSDDEKTILGRLKEDQRLEKIDEPVPENNGYTHRDYLTADAEDVLAGIEKRYRARMAASDAQVQAIRALEMLKRPPLQEAPLQMPALQKVEVPKYVPNREEVEARLHAEWQQYDARLQAHLKRVQEAYFREPIKMPEPGKRVEAPVVLEEGVPNDPFAVQNESAPQMRQSPALVIETPPDPYAFARPGDETVVIPAMNEQPKKSGAFSKLSKLFS